MKRLAPCLIAITLLNVFCLNALGANVDLVSDAMKSAYARTDPTSRCNPVPDEILGWPKGLVERCEYGKGTLSAVAYLLILKPQTITDWIETACSKQLPSGRACFQTLLRCAKLNSGMMFAVSGNILEDMDGKPFANYFFRNGMTVSMTGINNGNSEPIALKVQEAKALGAESEIVGIRSGVTRLWRTLPRHFAKRYPDVWKETSLSTPEIRAAWLNLTRVETLKAIDKGENRLLEAYVAAHPVTLGSGKCPDDNSP